MCTASYYYLANYFTKQVFTFEWAEANYFTYNFLECSVCLQGLEWCH